MFRTSSKTTIGIIYAIFGILLFSAKAVLVKLAYKYNVDHLTLLLFRMVFAIPFYLVIAYKQKNVGFVKIKPKDYFWLFVFGFLGYYLASLFDFIGLQYIKAGLERIILFIYPTIVVLLSWLFFNKKITTQQSLAIFITYIGVLITFWDEIGLEGSSVYKGAIFIFLSAITYASYLVGSGWLIPKFGVLRFTANAMIVSTFCVVIHFLIQGNYEIFNYPKEVYFIGVVMAVFCTLIPSFLVSAAIEKLGANTFSIFGSLGPVSTIILAFIFLGEHISFLQVVGMLIVIGGVSIISKKKEK
ncbi:EamA domain-containing membrane protein RarD [Maribacter vaceletii]|uniref:EamA domain-containing membrane protein RarD n=1 Tax=Maribacter vaceletii TaxID=1206816 RepID=A0A495EAK8_9FLAO|nr:DMT family transporter [Maribacter vaceletii]RKR12897.1 EamA domain-containing membrane protein RarD [Maribacter vaceletii]